MLIFSQTDKPQKTKSHEYRYYEMHQLSWSFTDCYSSRHIALFMLVHSQLNGCPNHLGPHITMVMMFPVLCPCFTQPLTFKVSLTHMNEHSFDSAIPFCSASIWDDCIHVCFWKGKPPPSVPPRRSPSPPAPLFPLRPRIPLLPCLSLTRFPFKWAAPGGVQMCERCRWLTGFFFAHD